MSFHFKAKKKYYVPKWGPSRTKQSFKDATDINKIIKKAQRQGGLAHVQKYDKAVYGEFEGYDLLEAYQKVDRAQEIFDDLPSEVKNEFDHDALKFAGFASDPANIDRLGELIPAIAEPGRYFPNPVNQGAQSGSAGQRPADIPAEPESPSEGPTEAPEAT